MSKHAELVKQLRQLVIIDEVGSNNSLGKEAANAIEALEAQNKELDERRRGLVHVVSCHDARISELEAENAKLRQALRPFANKAKVFHDYVEDYPIMFGAEPPLRVGDLRAARAALEKNDG